MIVYAVTVKNYPGYGDHREVSVHATREGAVAGVEAVRDEVDRCYGPVYPPTWPLGVGDVWHAYPGGEEVRIIERELLP